MRTSRSRQDLNTFDKLPASRLYLCTMAGLLLCCVMLLLSRPSRTMDTIAAPQHLQLSLAQAQQRPQPISSADEDEGTLLAVQAVFRHGARTPLNTLFWPDSPYSDCHNTYPGPEIRLFDETGLPNPPPVLDLDMPLLPGGCRMGQLTHIGHDMAIQLGSWLRRRYVEGYRLLPPVFRPEAVAPRSTCIQRAMLTLQGVLAGMYPDLKGPVDVAASLEKFEFEYGKNTTCPALGPLIQQIQALQQAKDANNKELRRLAQVVRLALGFPPGDKVDWVHLRDTMVAMQTEGLPLPVGPDSDVMAVINQQAVRHEAAVVGPTPQDGLVDEATARKVIALSVGPLAHRLRVNMLTAVQAAESASAAGAGSGAKGGAGGDPQAAKRGWGLRSTRALLAGAAAAEHGPGGRGAGIGQVGREARRLQGERSGGLGGVGGSGGKSAGTAGRPGLDAAAPPSLWLYSGHDSTITPLLVALGQPETDWPPFTANLVFELWRRPIQGTGSNGGASSNSNLNSNSKHAGGWAGRKDPGHAAARVQGARGSGGGGGSGGSGASGAGKGAFPGLGLGPPRGQYSVRVLYNHEVMDLKYSRPGGWMDLADFERLLQPWSLSDEAKAASCAKVPSDDMLRA